MERLSLHLIESKRLMMRRTVPREGFTLIELLVAITVFSIVAVALYATMRTGIDAWRRGDEASSLYQEARLALATMAQELGNVNTTFGEGIEIPFQGESGRLCFPALVNTAGPGAPAQLEVGKVTYYLDWNEGSLKRGQSTYVQGLQEAEEPSEEIASSVMDLGFEYYYERVEDKEIQSEWRDLWEVEEDTLNIPRGVRVILTIQSPRSTGGTNFTRTVWIAMGEPGELEE